MYKSSTTQNNQPTRTTMQSTLRRKQWVIIRNSPDVRSDYPYPECITGGWMALLSEAERGIVDAKALEMRRIDSHIFAQYTGFDALDAETQASIRQKLDENKQWERTYGTVWFRTPDPVDPRLLTMPEDSGNSLQTRVWRGWYITAQSIWLGSRRRQANRMMARNAFPTRTYIART
jgi:hypothetical protein